MTTPATLPPRPRGLYFVANDYVRDWTIGFLESLRTVNADLPAVMIPFDEKADQVRALASRYRFDIFDDPESFAALDKIGARFYPANRTAMHTFRKFAVFWGPLERFLFSDVDVILVEKLDELFDAAENAGYDLLHADEDMKQVYEGEAFVRKMIETYGARGFNTGFWTARRGLFSLADVDALARQALAENAGLNRGTYEQGFLNYCCDMRRLRYANFADVLPDLSSKLYCGVGEIRREADGAYRQHLSGDRDDGKRMKAFHWAGFRQNVAMPYRSLFLNYRLRPESSGYAAKVKTRDFITSFFWRAIALGRGSGPFMRWYKAWTPSKLQNIVGGLLRNK